MIQIRDLRFRYPGSDFELAINSLEIPAAHKVAVVGPSGSGKTTLLNLLSGISVPNQGEIVIGSQSISKLSDAQRRDFRISKIGMVFQQFELIEYLTALDNILAPYWINRTLQLEGDVQKRVESLSHTVGIADKLRRRPAQLSQGEQQRVAICRALVPEPGIILADEPTGNLDPKNKRLILDILFQQAQQNGQTLIVVTHDMGILDGFDSTVDFSEFRIEDPSVEVSQP